MISVIIVNYHCADLSIRAMASVQAQAVPHEILLVDNSVSPSEADRLAANLPPQTRLIVSPSNLGFGRACNQAYARARGDMILLLNPDALLHPGCLEQLCKPLLADRRIGAVGPRIFWDSARHYLLPPSIHPGPEQLLWHSMNCRYAGLREYYSQRFRAQAIRLWQRQDPCRVDALSGGLALLSRKALEHAGGLFDEGFFMYFEDSDLFWRLRQAGYRLAYAPRAEASHSYEHHPAKHRLMVEAAPYYYAKHFAHAPRARLANWIARRNQSVGNIELPGTQALGVQRGPLCLPVPEQWQQGWLLEISPSPWLVPAIGQFGQGPQASIAADCWPLLHSGHYYSRLGAPLGKTGQMPVWQWSK
ncbi:glycosyltransferase family 2 protein [Magnetovirga frankeli]|uniref:glycosyltransferase family 2 protein n=1 Tax=Magnetovirga frankeli TaxID=947516 RepID=UPI0012932E32|nr:glycosyltransferase family 2 protein [gamma proteobacterium SS-5]